MFRRLFLTLLILVIIIAGSGSVVLAEENEIEIAFIRATGEPYYQFGSQAAEAAAKKLGVKMVVYTSNFDSAQELANVQDAIARGCDGILIYAVSLSSERAAVDTASKAKVPIFIQGGYHSDILPLSAGFMDNSLKEFSKPLGIWMAENLEKGKVAVIEGALGRGDAEAYTEGFKEGLSQNPNLEIVTTITAEWNRQKAYEAATNIITAHPDIVGLFVQNEDMTVGVASALERLGKLEQVTIVSQNGAPYGLDLIREGKLQYTNANPPSIASVMALRILLGVVKGEIEPGHFYWAPTQLISKENLDVTYRWDASEEEIEQWLDLPLPEPVIPPPIL
ncbi:sugar ABC transporter substrate-binding protein [Atribacter laminatus]|uniref:Ribose import binding protein RbsB n=1 Tax=Atribacter laminatus TaxID=2847778 RepID=A0A7T1ALB2_ATRLM|nr:sugar ABC transporter substrate-binding protein [Atribacter laminatus]QPM68028.1 Ribose import binding protein RbsB [Atribacter laminatus]